MREKPKQKRKDGLRRQAQLMEIAMNLFSEKGFHSTSVEDIVNTAGIVKGTFYLHFKSKQDILDKIIDTNLNLLYNSLKILDISIPKPIEEIRNLYIQVATRLMSDPQLKIFVKMALREGMGLDSGFLNKINSFFQGMIQLSTQYIRKAQDDGTVIKNIDPVITSYCIIGATKEVLYHWTGMDEKLDIEKTINTIIDIYFEGIIARK